MAGPSAYQSISVMDAARMWRRYTDVSGASMARHASDMIGVTCATPIMSLAHRDRRSRKPRQNPVPCLRHPDADGTEALAAGGRHGRICHPRVDLVSEALLRLGECEALPFPEVAFAQVVFDVKGGPGRGRDDLRRLPGSRER